MPDRIEVADLVVALHHLGRVFRAPVRRGTTGVVTVREADGALRVAFSNGHTLRLDPADVAPAPASVASARRQPPLADEGHLAS